MAVFTKAPLNDPSTGIERHGMSAIDGLSNINYNSFLISGNSPVKKADSNFSINGAATSLTEAPKTDKLRGSAAEEFQKYMQMTPAEKVRYGVLSELGITEEQLGAMPPEQREAMEKKIADMIAIRTGGTDQNALALQQGQSATNANLFKVIEAGSKVALPLVNIFS